MVPPIADRDGNLYGVASTGGVGSCNSREGCGTVYKLAAGGTFSVSYAFTGSNDGGMPEAELIRGSDGTLYGTTTAGGDMDCGTVFKIAPDGTESTLHAFTYHEDGRDGCCPQSQLIVDKKRNIYGTTNYGGKSGNGTFFRIAPDGNEKILHTFSGQPDGSGPLGSLTKDSSGNLYGATVDGGANNNGAIFKLSK